MKKYISILVVICFVFSLLAGCGSAPAPAAEKAAAPAAEKAAAPAEEKAAAPTEKKVKEDKDITIGFSFPTLREERWAVENKLCAARAKEKGVKYISQDAGLDENEQSKQMENLVSQNCDVILIGAQNNQAAVPSVQAAIKAGIPVMSYIRLTPVKEQSAIICYDFKKIGKIMGEAAVKAKPKGNYIIVAGDTGDSVAHWMRDGFHEAIDPLVTSKDITLLSDQYMPKWDPLEALANVENVLTKNNNKLDGILICNDTMAGAAAQALAAQKLTGKVFLPGMDGDLAALQRIVEGKQDMTVLFRHEVIANAAIDAAYELAKGQKPKAITGTQDGIPAIYVDIDVITKDNINDIVIKGGIQKVEDVYKNVPKDKWPK